MQPKTTDRLDDAQAFEALGALARKGLSGEVADDVHLKGRARLVEAVSAAGRPRGGRKVAWGAALGLAAAMGAAAIAYGVHRPSAAPSGDALAIEGATLTEGGFVQAPVASEATLRFGGGTDVRLAHGARARVLGGARHVVLEHGGASVHVTPRASLAFAIDVGPFTVHATDASYDVAWDDGGDAGGGVLEVTAHAGHAEVRGPSSPNGVTVSAGQHLVARGGELRIEPIATAAADAPSAAASAADEAPREALDVPDAPEPLGPAGHAASGGTRTSWSARVRAGEYASVVREAEGLGVDGALRTRPLGDVVALADAARYTNRADLARRALLAERRRYPSSAEAHTAAFLLGRLADDQDHAPAAAIEWYDRYMHEAPRGAFAPEALGRKMVAVSRVSGKSAAQPIAEAYLRTYPHGSYASVARELTGQ